MNESGAAEVLVLLPKSNMFTLWVKTETKSKLSIELNAQVSTVTYDCSYAKVHINSWMLCRVSAVLTKLNVKHF